jgi:hypothetical protein
MLTIWKQDNYPLKDRMEFKYYIQIQFVLHRKQITTPELSATS